MALQPIAAFFVPLSSDDTREMYRAARRARLAAESRGNSGITAENTLTTSSSSSSPPAIDDGAPLVVDFTPLRPLPPLAFICAHPLCRVVAEGSPEGVTIGHTHYERPEPPLVPSTAYVWDISPPPPPELTVHVTRLPLCTSGFVEGLWWLRCMGRTRWVEESFLSPNAAVTLFPPFCPVKDIRIVLERESQPPRRRRVQEAAEEVEDVATAAPASVVTGSKEKPLHPEDLLHTVSGEGCVGDVRGVPFTSLELQQLCFLPSALRLLPCLFGPQLTTVLFSRCTCLFDASLRDAQQTRYTTLPLTADEEGQTVNIGAVVMSPLTSPSSSSVLRMMLFPYGAAGVSYLSLSGCGSEAFWSCINKFFLCPQGDREKAPMTLTPLAVLDVGDNKGLTTRQLLGLLRAVKQRNTVEVSPAGTSPTDSYTELISLQELNTSFTYAIKDVKWRGEFSGLGCRIRRLAMARCDVAGDTVVDILCAGDGDPPRPLVSVAEEPFSASIRRLLLLDMRWNLRVTSANIQTLRDGHAIHCKHLRVAGTAIDWEEGNRFATTVTP